MEAENRRDAVEGLETPASMSRSVFLLLLFALVGVAILRSSIATRFDGLNADEGFHIGAGVAYVETGDFRLNPEHPPLVKLWTGAFVAPVYERSPYRRLEDKSDERSFVERDVYVTNKPDSVQARSRIAMFTLNGLLLLLFAIVTRRVFGDVIALAATAFLAIDPTVAAHLPQVMTDLPVALLSTTAMLLAAVAFRSWRGKDLLFAAIVLGLTLAAKHSAVVTMFAVAVAGLVMVNLPLRGTRFLLRARRLGLVAMVLAGAVVVLWGFYAFRFHESPGSTAEQFNRPLAGKISDVHSPRYRLGLNVMYQGRLFPRAYTWGMADTIRAGAEGRARKVFAFGRESDKAPFYFFPAVIALKLPIGLLALTAFGACLWIAGRMPRRFLVPLSVVVAFAALFLVVLSSGSTYAGIRHALPVVPPLALLAAMAVWSAVESRSTVLGVLVVVATLGALLSAVPVTRPWEYYNEAIGGGSQAYRFFSDEGIDLSLRTRDIERYYNAKLRPSGEVPYIVYPMKLEERRARDLDWIGKDDERDAAKMSDVTLRGTVFVGARQARSKPAFRNAIPVARFGNLFVFRGAFRDPDVIVMRLAVRANNKIYSAEPDIEGAIRLLSEALALAPKRYHLAVELGNQYVRVGKREEALRAYEIARQNAPAREPIHRLLTQQIARVRTEPLGAIKPLRNPRLE